MASSSPSLRTLGTSLAKKPRSNEPVGLIVGRRPGLLDRRPHGVERGAHALPDLAVERARPAALGVLQQEVLALLELGRRQAPVVLAERDDAERHVASLVGEHVAQQLVQQRLVGAPQHVAERGQGEALDDDLHAEVGDVPPGVLEQRGDLGLQHRTHRVGLADLGAQVAGEDLGVAGLVHRLRGGVVLGVDPRHRLDDLGRRQHGALLAVHELAEAGLEELDGELRELRLGPRWRSATRARRPRPARAASPACRSRRAASGSTSIDQSSSVTLFHCEALALLYSDDELLALALVAPRVDARGVVVDQLDRRSHLGGVRQLDGVMDDRTPFCPSIPARTRRSGRTGRSGAEAERGGRGRWRGAGRWPGSWRTRWTRGCAPSSG